jgi:hypothetical protein
MACFKRPQVFHPYAASGNNSSPAPILATWFLASYSAILGIDPYAYTIDTNVTS